MILTKLDKETSLDDKVSDISMKLTSNFDYKKLISCVSLGIGVGGAALLTYILGAAVVPGVGWAAAAILSVGGIFGLIFSDSKEKKLEKSINTIISKIEKNIRKIDKNIDSKKRSFILNIQDHFAKIRDDYDNKTALDISNLENLKLETFNESKNKYLKARELLGL